MDKLENAFDTMRLFEGTEADSRLKEKIGHRPKKKEAEKLQNRFTISLNNELYDLLRAEADRDCIPIAIKARAIILDYYKKKGLYK